MKLKISKRVIKNKFIKLETLSRSIQLSMSTTKKNRNEEMHNHQERLLSLLQNDVIVLKDESLLLHEHQSDSLPDQKNIENDTDDTKTNDTNGYDKDKKHDSNKIRELQIRLEKRNLLLDLVRKAYHRDVLAVKDCIIRQFSMFK